jgi:TonB family protein
VGQCAALICLIAGSFPTPSVAQKAEKSPHPRRLLYRVEPDYPWDLKRAHIGGIVRLDIVVSPHGTVDTINVVGGNPILSESATKAIKKWKYAPADSESIVRVNVEFNPDH